MVVYSVWCVWVPLCVSVHSVLGSGCWSVLLVTSHRTQWEGEHGQYYSSENSVIDTSLGRVI